MSLSVGHDRHQRAMEAEEHQVHDAGPQWLLRGVRIFTVVTAMAGVGCLATAFSLNEWRTAMVGSTLTVVSAIGASLWCASTLLADRRTFYQRGHLEGWMRGWRGQEPEVKDPLLR